MSNADIRMETAYCLGTMDDLISTILNELDAEILIEDLKELVTKIVADFTKWQEDKDDSTLELLHQFIFEEMDLKKYLEEIVK